MSPTLACFDVDGTLLRSDCLLVAARLRHRPLALLRRAVILLPAFLAHALGHLSTARLKERFLAQLVLGGTAEDGAWLGGPFTEALIGRLHPPALARLRWHQRQGHRVVLCSASPRPLLQPLAERLGVELVATELVPGPLGWQARLAGPNCKGPEKLRRLAAHLGSPLEACQFEAYGDSRGDRELLQAAAIPHYRSFGPEPRPYPAFSLGALVPVVGLALLGYAVVGLWSQGAALGPLLQKLWPTVLLGLGLILVGYGLRFLRWRVLLTAVGQRPPWLADLRIWMGSYAFTATPGKSGETLRALLLRQDCGTPAPLTLMALLVERLTDATAVLLLVLVNAPVLLRSQVPLAIPVALTAAAVTLLVSVLRSRRGRRAIAGLAGRMLPRRLAGATEDGVAALAPLLTPRVLLHTTLIGAVAWSLEGLSLYLLLQAMGVQQASWGGASVAHTAAGMVGALTLLPGGLGTTEAGTIGLLTLQRVPLAMAAPATLLIRLMTLWFATGLGALCLLLPSPASARRTTPLPPCPSLAPQP
jgi:HAD superfamily hydrolase (TIGR01490 family)